MFEAWRAVFEAHGCQPLTVEEWSLWIGTDTDDAEIIELLVAGASRPVDLDAMHTARRAHRDDLLEAEAVRPGVEAWLDEADRAGLGLADRVELARREWVLGHLERLGLRDRFAHVVVRERRRSSASPRPTPTSRRAPRSASSRAAPSRSRTHRTASPPRRPRVCTASPCPTRSPRSSTCRPPTCGSDHSPTARSPKCSSLG